MNKFSMREINSSELDIAMSYWVNIANSLDMPIFEYEQTINLAKSTNEKVTSKESPIYQGVFDSVSLNLVALVEVQYIKYTGTGSQVKLFAVHLSPNFSPEQADKNAGVVTDIVNIYTMAIEKVIAISGENMAKTVKVYANNTDLFKIISLIYEHHILVPSPAVIYSLNGRWLVISTQ